MPCRPLSGAQNLANAAGQPTDGMRERMQLWKRQPDLATVAPALRDWYATALGQAMLAVERRLLGRQLGNAFGYHLLQLGVDLEPTLFEGCRVQRCFKAGPVGLGGDAPLVHCDFEALPFESDSLDVVVVHHVLEFANNPHAVLRELYRVVVPHGRILIVGFNPWSPFGLRMLASRFGAQPLWHNHLLAPARVTDWLQLLGFESERTDYGFHRLPFNRGAGWSMVDGDNPWSRHWPMGGIYLITAIKQAVTFIPLRQPRRLPAALTPLPVPKPTASAQSRRQVQRR